MHLKHACLPISPPEQTLFKTAHIIPYFRFCAQGGIFSFWGAQKMRPYSGAGRSFSRTIHAMRKSAMPNCRSSGMATPRGTFHHFARQSRQQQAQACWALKTGCPRIGVCLPSFGGFAGARRVRMKSSQCRRITSMPFSAMYFLSASDRWNRERNFDFASRAKAES